MIIGNYATQIGDAAVEVRNNDGNVSKFENRSKTCYSSTKNSNISKNDNDNSCNTMIMTIIMRIKKDNNNNNNNK